MTVCEALLPARSEDETVNWWAPVVEVSIGLPDATGPAQLAKSAAPSGSVQV